MIIIGSQITKDIISIRTFRYSFFNKILIKKRFILIIGALIKKEEEINKGVIDRNISVKNLLLGLTSDFFNILFKSIRFIIKKNVDKIIIWIPEIPIFAKTYSTIPKLGFEIISNGVDFMYSMRFACS